MKRKFLEPPSNYKEKDAKKINVQASVEVERNNMDPVEDCNNVTDDMELSVVQNDSECNQPHSSRKPKIIAGNYCTPFSVNNFS